MKLSLGLLLCLCLLGACAPQQPQRKMTTVIDMVSQKAVIEQTARRFIQSFYTRNTEQILALSAYPFYMDDGGILNYPMEWQESLSALFASRRAVPFEILHLRVLASQDIPGYNIQVWNRLLELKYHQKVYVLAEIQLHTSPQPSMEAVLLIMDYHQEEERWKILGFFS